MHPFTLRLLRIDFLHLVGWLLKTCTCPRILRSGSSKDPSICLEPVNRLKCLGVSYVSLPEGSSSVAQSFHCTSAGSRLGATPSCHVDVGRLSAHKCEFEMPLLQNKGLLYLWMLPGLTCTKKLDFREG